MIKPASILFILFLMVFIVYIYKIKTVLLERLIYLALALVGIVLLVYPSLSTWVANKLGIGRGADLLLYFVIILGLFYAVISDRKIHQLEKQITLLVREIALRDAASTKVLPPDPRSEQWHDD